VVHAKPDGKRSRRYYRFRSRGTARDILDDSWSQYESRGFLPIGLVKWFGLELACAQGYLRTYHHGDLLESPVTWNLTPDLMWFLGLYVAEGHSDQRQIAFTFNLKETDLVERVVRAAKNLGLRASIEERERNAVRVKVFGGLTHALMPSWCGRGAKAKR